VREGCSFEEAHAILEAMTPDELVYPFHIEMIRHGRALCRPTSPKCEKCPVRDECLYYEAVVEPARTEEPHA
jgi:endonuclease-3